VPAVFREILTEEDLDNVFTRSFAHPVALLKHSNSCGISAHVMYDLREIDAEINVVVVQTHRELSNQIAIRLAHRHQSPQAFVIKDGEATYHATHYGIDPKKIEELLRN
jgi:bacillithiol system protein YtxJ